jgi:type IV secretory pathway TrbD component
MRDQHPVYNTLNQRPTFAGIDRSLLMLATGSSGLVYMTFGNLAGVVSLAVMASIAAWLTKADPLLPGLWIWNLREDRIYDPGLRGSKRYRFR